LEEIFQLTMANFRTRLEVTPDTPEGCAWIRLNLPDGSGLFEFKISKAGRTDTILCPAGWQSADHWYRFPVEQLNVLEAQILLDKQSFSHLSFSNYLITVRNVSNGSSIDGVLSGGVEYVSDVNGSTRIFNSESIGSTSYSSDIKDVQINITSAVIPESSISSSYNSTSNASVDFPELPKEFNNVSGSFDSSHNSNVEFDAKNIDAGPISHVNVDNKIAPIEPSNGLLAAKSDSDLISNIDPIHSESLSNFSNKKRSVIFLVLFIFLIVISVYYFLHRSQSVPNKELPINILQDSQSVVNIQAANNVINDNLPQEHIYFLAEKWLKENHFAESFLLFEHLAGQNHAPSIVQMAHLYDPVFRSNSKITFPEVNLVASVKWYQLARTRGQNVDSEVSSLILYIKKDTSISDQEKSDLISNL